jgi:hypothetical protein
MVHKYLLNVYIPTSSLISMMYINTCIYIQILSQLCMYISYRKYVRDHTADSKPLWRGCLLEAMISKNRLLGCSCLWFSSNLYFACACIHMYIYTQQLHTCYPAQRQALAAQQKTCTNYLARTFPFYMPTYKHLLPICFNSHSSVLATYSVSIYTDVDIQNKHTICVRALQPR